MSAALLVAAVSAISPAVSLASTVYGNYPAATVDFENVREDEITVDTTPKFGAPTVAGDSLDFNPVGFAASTSGLAVDMIDIQLSFDVVAHPGKAISNFKLSEAGDVSLTGLAAIGSQTTFASVTANVFIEIQEINGIPIGPYIEINDSLTFSPSGGTYGLGTDGGGGPLYNQIWMGKKVFDLQQKLIDLGIAGSATRIHVTLDNTLSALSQVGTSAKIAKKDADGVIITVNVPEPAGCMLALFAIAAGLAYGRRAR